MADVIDGVFARQLRSLIYQRGVNQTEFSKSIGVSLNTTAALLQRKHSPKYVTIVKIANVYHVSTDYLCGLTNDPTPMW